MKLAILIPSRGRPKELYRFFESLNETISGINEIVLCVGIDSNDPCKKDYLDIFYNIFLHKRECVSIVVYESKRKKVSETWNDLAYLRLHRSTIQYFMMANDDLVFVTKNWDVILVSTILEHTHPFYLYYFDDGINGESHAAHPIISHNWITRLGYFIPEMFRYFYVDTWLFDIAKKANVTCYIDRVKTKHLHFTTGSDIPFDDTYKRNRNDNQSAKDKMLFDETEGDRLHEAVKLTDAINNFKKLNELVS